MKILLTVFIASILFVTSVFANEVYAQTFKFELVDPGQTIEVGDSFQVKIFINTEGEETINGDALIIFEQDKLNINSSQSGDFFTYFTSTPLSGVDNKYLISSWEESIAHSKSSTTDNLFATLSLTAKACGNTSLTFDCTPGTGADSNINRASDSQDIIDCNGLTSLTVNNCSSTGPTSAPTSAPNPTAVPTALPTSAPTDIPIPTKAGPPRAGSIGITFAALGIGVLLTTVGVLFAL